VPLGAGFLFNHIAASLLMWTILGGNLLLIGAFFILAFLIPRCTGAAISTARSGDCLHSEAPDQAEKGFELVAVDKQEKIHVSQAYFLCLISSLPRRLGELCSREQCTGEGACFGWSQRCVHHTPLSPRKHLPSKDLQ